ncbi:lysoplasmalogenase family protein [Corynebacterium alimapuense]|uniref:Lysoplasmalogenase n=1 Tax=Corynebacterium alimapuense TaxID=1576874 RepID=A0A3M8K787_9CORY|nr:lysoplasmalogenase family protein [Corynebacterium alimapuense]RNE49000.1 lysoplasmalogenase [Corynebacterium alimapuense]
MRLPYLVAGGLFALSRAIGSDRLRVVAKPLLMPLLSLQIGRLPRADRAIAVTGLGGAWIGDLMLLRDDRLLPAAFAFAANHAACLTLLRRRGAKFHPRQVLARALPVAIAARLAGDRLPLVVVYGGMVAAVSALAADPQLRGRGLGLGGNLFLLSDSLILVRTIVASAGTTSVAVDRILDSSAAVTYAGAQQLLIEGLRTD